MADEEPNEDRVEEPEDEDLIDESPEHLEPDPSPEATMEGGLTEGRAEPRSEEGVELEDDEEAL